MTDIVERLRAQSALDARDDLPASAGLEWEAADEIERLRLFVHAPIIERLDRIETLIKRNGT